MAHADAAVVIQCTMLQQQHMHESSVSIAHHHHPFGPATKTMCADTLLLC